MLQNYKSFSDNANFNYAVGSLIVYYFFHFDGDGDRSSINAFLKANQQGKHGKLAVEALLQGRTMLELVEQISKAWSTRGIKIKFTE